NSPTPSPRLADILKFVAPCPCAKTTVLASRSILLRTDQIGAALSFSIFSPGRSTSQSTRSASAARALAPRQRIHQRRLAAVRRARDGDHQSLAQPFAPTLCRKHFLDLAEQR